MTLLTRLQIGRRNATTADKMDVQMDVTACHANGCPLDLKKLLDADDFNFAHDIFGINQHINRKTGKLERFFVPRCAY